MSADFEDDERTADERYARYARMKSMLPEGAVRQRMAADGFSVDEIDSFFANVETSSLPPPSIDTNDDVVEVGDGNMDGDDISLLPEIEEDSSVGFAASVDSKSSGLPDKWIQKTSSKHNGRPYWRNERTGQTTWKDPFGKITVATTAASPAAPPPEPKLEEEGVWRAIKSARIGKTYWRHTKTGKISWTDPDKDKGREKPSTTATVAPEKPAPNSTRSTKLSTPSPSMSQFVDSSKSEPLRAAPPQPTATKPAKRTSLASALWEMSDTGSNLTAENSNEEVQSDVRPISAPKTLSAPAATDNKKAAEELKLVVENADAAALEFTPKYNLMRVPTTAHVQLGGFGRASVLVNSADCWEEMFSKRHNLRFWKHKYTGELTYKDPTEKEKQTTDSKDDTKSASISINTAKEADPKNEAQEPAQEQPGSEAEAAAQSKERMLWEEEYSEKYKRKYWRNKNTKEIKWKCPFPGESNENGATSSDQATMQQSEEHHVSEDAGKPKMSRRMTAYLTGSSSGGETTATPTEQVESATTPKLSRRMTAYFSAGK